MEAQNATSKKPIFGVMGPSIISKIIPDYIKSIKIEPMHMISGLAKMLLCVFFSENYNNHPASLLQHVKVIDKRLLSMTPPAFIDRLPRVTGDLHYWKAWEYIIFLIYCSVVILADEMNAEYFNHHKKLVLAIYLLSQPSISKADIRCATGRLKSYVKDFEKLYGTELMTPNLHSILHIPDSVK